MANQQGILIVLSGPSGAGKGTICKALLKEVDIQYSTSATTRKPRVGEQHGREYLFLEKEDFEEKIKQNAFLEWAKVYDNYYGTPIEFVNEALMSGKDCILEIDPQGALKVQERKPDAVLVFIAPPSIQELEDRITSRGTENISEIRKRMNCAQEEMLCMCNYDYVIINDTIEFAVEKMKAVLLAEKCRVQRNNPDCADKKMKVEKEEV